VIFMLEQIEQYVKPVVTAEELLACLFAEYAYWRKASEDRDGTVPGDMAMTAVGAISNVIAFATVEGFRADWHPAKEAKGVR